MEWELAKLGTNSNSNGNGSQQLCQKKSGRLCGNGQSVGHLIVTVFLVALAILLMAWFKKKSNGSENNHEGTVVEVII